MTVKGLLNENLSLLSINSGLICHGVIVKQSSKWCVV